eukprot:8045949-Alexandrium_andersonii.AAC.1
MHLGEWVRWRASGRACGHSPSQAHASVCALALVRPCHCSTACLCCIRASTLRRRGVRCRWGMDCR